FYRIFDLKMPVIFPRFSATFVEPAIARISQELPFKFNDYEKRIEDLEKAYVQQTGEMNIEAVFKKWKKGIEDLEAYHSKLITQVDETLNGTSKKAQAHYFNELERLKGKTYRAIKKNEDIQMNRIRRIQNNFFPDRNLQERALCGIYYMNKYGIDIWDRVLENLNDSVDLRQHTLIYL
ncbi:MAG TPA: bacillithiol biosynthesis BshC, partial [Balneolaceae bacterium]|nr:bacillithiol biosynthesis BshC [Balneolaceae bacterium]